jgi:hypothetical protein
MGLTSVALSNSVLVGKTVGPTGCSKQTIAGVKCADLLRTAQSSNMCSLTLSSTQALRKSVRNQLPVHHRFEQALTIILQGRPLLRVRVI